MNISSCPKLSPISSAWCLVQAKQLNLKEKNMIWFKICAKSHGSLLLFPTFLQHANQLGNFTSWWLLCHFSSVVDILYVALVWDQGIVICTGGPSASYEPWLRLPTLMVDLWPHGAQGARKLAYLYHRRYWITWPREEPNPVCIDI